METVYSIIKRGFEENPDKKRLDFKHPLVKITADKVRSDDSIDLVEVWFKVITGEQITEEQVRSAIALFHPDSKYVNGGFSYYTKEKSKEEPLKLEEIPSVYANKKRNLSSILDIEPRVSINDTVLDEIKDLPLHAWGRVYCAFEDFDQKHPEFGYSWNSVVLYKDGMALRVAKQANLVHSLSPSLAEISEELNVEGKSDAEIENTMIRLIESSNRIKTEVSHASIGDLLNAPQPYITGSELNEIAKYASRIFGRDIGSLDYQVEPLF